MYKVLLNKSISFASIQQNAMYNVNSMVVCFYVETSRAEKKKFKAVGMTCLAPARKDG